VVFDDSGLLYVGDPGGHILVVDSAHSIGGALSEQRRIAATAWAVESSLHLVDKADGTKMLLTSGSGWLSLVSLADGHTLWATRAGSVNTLTGLPTPFDGLNPCRSMTVAATEIERSSNAVPELFYCADDVGTITERGLEDGALTARTFDRQAGITGTIAITTDGSELVAGSYTNNSLATWRLDGSGPIQHLVATVEGSSATGGYSSDGSTIGSARWREVLSGSIIDVESGARSSVPGLWVGWGAAPDEAWLTTDGLIAERYNLTSQNKLTGRGIPLENSAGAFVNDVAHQRIYVSYSDSVRTYDETGHPIGSAIRSEHPGATINSAFGTPDGTHIVVSYWDGTRLYDTNTGTQTDAPDLPIITSIISQNGIAAGTTADGRIYLFDPNTLKITAELPASHGYAVAMSFNNDGSRLVVGNTTDGERVYEVGSRTQLGDAIPIDRGVFSFLSSISPDGQQLAIPVGRLGVALWDLHQAHWSDAACRVAGRSLTQAEWDHYLGTRWGPYHQTCVDGHANP
jgi:WD40 repeat protein